MFARCVCFRYLQSFVFAGFGVCILLYDSSAGCACGVLACGVLAGLPPKNLCLDYKGILNSITIF